MGAAEPTRFTAMQQKYAGAQLTPAEWDAFRLRFAEIPAPLLQRPRAVPKRR